MRLIINDLKVLKNILKNFPDAKIHQLRFDQSDGFKKITKKINDFLTEHPQVKVVMVPSSRVSYICEAIHDDKLLGLNLVGFDTTPQNVQALNKGIVAFLISQKSFNQVQIDHNYCKLFGSQGDPYQRNTHTFGDNYKRKLQIQSL